MTIGESFVRDRIRAASLSGTFGVAIAIGLAQPAGAVQYSFTTPQGLSALAELILLNPTTVEIRLQNTSTDVPAGFDGAASLLTTFSWDFDTPGVNPGDTQIAGGSIVIGPSSQTINFDSGTYGPGTNVGGEWGFGNMDGTGALINFISSNAAQATPFGGPNLDGPVGMDGPQGGLAANPLTVDLGGLGAIQDQVIATINLTAPIASLSAMVGNGLRVEFGSNAAFINIPAPAALPLLLGAGLLGRRRRR